MKTYLRSVGAVLVGVIVITLIVEPIEFLLVALVNGERVTDPDVYYSIRNQPSILTAKAFYNFAGGAVGGYLATWIAGPRENPRLHGWMVALVQGATLLWAMINPAMSRTAPAWAWLMFLVMTVAGVIAGTEWAARREVR